MRARLNQRLKRLEDRVRLADEPEEYVIEFVGSEGEVVKTLVIRPGALASPISSHRQSNAFVHRWPGAVVP
jgi:hypothetical protein